MIQVQEFYDKETNTLTYIVFDTETKDAVIIDPVLNYDPASGAITYNSVKQYVKFIDEHGLKLHYTMETHAHADHISSAQVIKSKYHVPSCIGHEIIQVQKIFAPIFNLKKLELNGSQFDQLLHDDQEFEAGSLKIKVLQTPGHTPACLTYVIGENAFTGDSMFMPDSGTGRCDFPGGSAKSLYNSITKKIFTLPEHYKVYVGHDYQPGGRPLAFCTTVKAQKEGNCHVTSSTTEEEYVKFREGRDATLSAPRLLLPSIQANIDAGHLPAADDNGVSYIRIPLKIVGSADN